MVKQNIAWLEISVHDIRLVEKVYGTKQPEQDGNRMLFIKPYFVLQQYFPKIAVHVVHDNEYVFQVLRVYEVVNSYCV